MTYHIILKDVAGLEREYFIEATNVSEAVAEANQQWQAEYGTECSAWLEFAELQTGQSNG